MLCSQLAQRFITSPFRPQTTISFSQYYKRQLFISLTNNVDHFLASSDRTDPTLPHAHRTPSTPVLGAVLQSEGPVSAIVFQSTHIVLEAGKWVINLLHLLS